MSSNISGVAVHHLVRDDAVYKVVEGNSEIQISATAQRFVDELHKLYARRPSKSYGKFAADTVNFPTSTLLKEYLEGDQDFPALSLSLMKTLQVQAQRKSGSTGGHVFFADVTTDGKRYLLVAIVNDRISAALTEENDLEDVSHLDLDGFRFAGRVNFTGWAADEERYIGFLKGKGNVSDYFREFLGCDSTSVALVETTHLVDAITSFVELQDMDKTQKDNVKERAKDICERVSKAQTEIDFEAFANELWPHNPQQLLDVLADPERKLSDGFIPDRRAIRGLVRYKAITDNWSIEFDWKAVHQGKIAFDPEEKTLLLRELPDHLISELNKDRAHG